MIEKMNISFLMSPSDFLTDFDHFFDTGRLSGWLAVHITRLRGFRKGFGFQLVDFFSLRSVQSALYNFEMLPLLHVDETFRVSVTQGTNCVINCDRRIQDPIEIILTLLCFRIIIFQLRYQLHQVLIDNFLRIIHFICVGICNQRLTFRKRGVICCKLKT